MAVKRLRTEQDIIEAVKKVAELEDDLYMRMEDDYGLFRGDPHKVKVGESYTDNRAQTLTHMIDSALDTAKLALKIPASTETHEQRRPQAKTERFVHGCIDRANHNRRRRGEPDLQSEMAWHACNRGWIVAVPLCYKTEDEGNPTDVEIALWDRRWTRYVMGRWGPKWMARERKMHPRDVMEEYEIELDDGKTEVDVIEFLDDEIHSIIIDEEFAKKPKDHQIGHFPGIIQAVGGTPSITSTKFSDTIRDRGESVFALNRNIYSTRNEMLSAYKTMVGKGQSGAYKVFSIDGNLVLEEDPGKSGKHISLATDKEDVVPLETLVMPQDAIAVLQASDMAIQEGGVPPTQFGQINQPLSGLALEILNLPTRAKIAPPKQAMEFVFEEIAYSLTRQFSSQTDEKNLGLEAVELRVEEKDEAKMIKFKPEDIKPERFKATLNIFYPTDQMQKWMQAQIAQQIGMPLQDIAEEVLEVEDIDLMMDKKLEEAAMQNPAIMMRMMARALIRRGRPEMADEVLMDYYEQLMQRKQRMMASMMPQGQAPQEQMMPRPSPGNPPPVPAQDSQMRLQQMGLVGPRGV